jgi:urease accessory protein
MHRITHRIPAALAGNGSGAIPLPLDHDARKRSRQRLVLDDGTELAIALAASEVLNEHDVLVADDGARFRVVARAERVLRVTSADGWLLLRAAYHLGNRHTRSRCCMTHC